MLEDMRREAGERRNGVVGYYVSESDGLVQRLLASWEEFDSPYKDLVPIVRRVYELGWWRGTLQITPPA